MIMKKYFVDGFAESFDTLRDLRKHILMMCLSDIKSYDEHFVYRSFRGECRCIGQIFVYRSKGAYGIRICHTPNTIRSLPF